MYTFVCIHPYVYICMYTTVCIHPYVYICMYTHMCAYICHESLTKNEARRLSAPSWKNLICTSCQKHAQNDYFYRWVCKILPWGDQWLFFGPGCKPLRSRATHLYVYVCMYTSVCIHLHTEIHMYIRWAKFDFTYMYICIHTESNFAHPYVCVYLCIHTYVYMQMCRPGA